MKKIFAIMLLVMCSGAIYAGIRLWYHQAHIALLKLRAKQYVQTQGIIDSCRIDVTRSGHTPRKYAGGKNYHSSAQSYAHVFLVAKYTVKDKTYTTRILKGISTGGYDSVRSALIAVMKMAPGQAVELRDYVWSKYYRVTTKFLCSQKFDSRVKTPVAIRYNPKNPEQCEQQLASFYWIGLILGLAGILFGLFLYAPAIILLGTTRLRAFLFLGGGVVVWLAGFPFFTAGMKTLFHSKKPPKIVIVMDEHFQCEDIEKYVIQQDPEKDAEDEAVERIMSED